jgi:hypothetical protein
MMNEETYKVLRAGVNRILEDRQRSVFGTAITSRDLSTYAFGDMATIEVALEKWERAGYIRILKPFRLCRPDEFCIEANSFIEQKSPIKGWLNWE